LAANKIGKVALSPFNGTGLAICAFAGVPLHHVSVAGFTDSTPTDVPFTYSAAINWGDGTPATPGTVARTSAGFSVAGDHVYNTEGNLPVTITVTRSDGAVLVINASANVGGFITSLYQEVLVRGPDAPGLQFWLQLEHAGVT